MAAGMLIFIWWRTPDRDRRSLIDALTLTVGLALLSWIYLLLPYVNNPGLSWLQKSVAGVLQMATGQPPKVPPQPAVSGAT